MKRSINSLKNGIIISFFFYFIEVITNYFYLPIIVFNVGIDNFGIYGLSLTIGSFILLFDFGFSHFIVNNFSRVFKNNNKNEANKLYGFVITYYFTIVIIFILILIIFNNQFQFFLDLVLNETNSSLINEILFFSILYNLLYLLFLPLEKIILASEKFSLLKTVSFFLYCIRISLTIFFVLNYYDIKYIFISSSVSYLFGIFIYLFYIYKKLSIKPIFFMIPQKEILNYFNFSFFIFLQIISTMIFSNIDRLIVSTFSNTLLLGYFGIGIQIYKYFESLAGTLNGLLFPRIVRISNIENTLSQHNFIFNVVKALFFSLLLIFFNFLFFGQTFLQIWLGFYSFEIYFTSSVYLFIGVFTLSSSIVSQYIWAKNWNELPAIIKFFISIISIFLNYFSYKIFGFFGLIISNAILIFICDFLLPHFIFYFKSSFTLNFNVLIRFIVFLLLLILFGFVINLFSTLSVLSFILSCSLFSLLYLLLFWFFFLNLNEKNSIKALLRTIY